MTSSPDLGFGGARNLSELRIVLCCNDGWKKCSAANAILGDENLDPQTAVRQGEVKDRWVIFVNLPSWVTHSVQHPWEHDQQQFKESVLLCPPGPHAFLMVVPLRPLREDEKREVEERLELLFECIWRRSIVLFTGKDGLGGKTVEQYIEGEPCLQRLVEKCGKRYHVLSHENRDVLLESIEIMVPKPHYFQNSEVLEELNQMKKALTEKASQRMMKVQKQRQSLRENLKEAAHRFSDITMVLLGKFCSGKSSTGNTILGKEEFDTSNVIKECVKKQGEVSGRMVTVIKTPGWRRDSQGQDGEDLIKEKIKQSESLCTSKAQVFLLVIQCDSSFTETDRKRVEEHLSVLSEETWQRTLVLFTWGDKLRTTAIELHIERWKELRWLVDKCGNRYHVFDSGSDSRSQVTELLERADEMLAENEYSFLRTKYHKTKEQNVELKEKMEPLEKEWEQQYQKTESDFWVRDGKRLLEISHLKEELRRMKEKETDTPRTMDVEHFTRGRRLPGQPAPQPGEEEEERRDRAQRFQRDEEELRERHQNEMEDLERESVEDSITKILEEEIERLQDRQTGKWGELERDVKAQLRRKREQRDWVEREERKRREEKESEMKKRQRGEAEALRQHYREEIREDSGGYLKLVGAVLGAVIGGITGGPGGAVWAVGGTVIGGVVGAKLGSLFGGGERPREKIKRRLSMETPRHFTRNE